MAIPDYQGLVQPALRALAESGDATEFQPLMRNVACRLGLTTEVVAERLPSGKETVFANRLHWALAYLQSTGMVAERQGAYRSTPAGCEHVPGDQPGDETEPPAAKPPVTASSLEGVLAESFSGLRERLRRELLNRIHEQRPQFFERLVIDLLVAMGYARRRCDLVRWLGRRGDGGIDGAVYQDALGLDVVYVQAKRYRPGSLVPASAVRDFAGSLGAVKARKGVFVTTACFPRSAGQFVLAVPSRIVLIDGRGLADLLIQHDIAVRPRETYDVKDVDESYFASWWRLPELPGYPSRPAATAGEPHER